jgi:hypothetical protein
VLGILFPQERRGVDWRRSPHASEAIWPESWQSLSNEDPSHQGWGFAI